MMMLSLNYIQGRNCTVIGKKRLRPSNEGLLPCAEVARDDKILQGKHSLAVLENRGPQEDGVQVYERDLVELDRHFPFHSLRGERDEEAQERPYHHGTGSLHVFESRDS